VPRLLHVSDLHFGHPSVPAQVEALEAIIARETFSAIVISGDLTQRQRLREYSQARRFLNFARDRAPVLTVPGNHDIAWWLAPFGVGSRRAMYHRYRRFVSTELEPSLRLPGLTIVGLNSAQGLRAFTLTARLRDLSVVGVLLPEQWERARAAFADAPAGDLKVLVIHHNLLRGRLSNRWGLVNRSRGIDQAAATGADLVLCGHDHEERVEEVAVAGRRLVVSNANTLSDRMRGGLPSALNVIDADAAEMCVALWEWKPALATFTAERRDCFAR
jgi:3',5'-cyclic AMP phosphodiesterase CpdA